MPYGDTVELRNEVYTCDVKKMAAWMEDEEITRFLNEKPDAAQRLKKLLKVNKMDLFTHHFKQQSLFYLIDLKEQEEPVGYLRLIPKANKKMEMVIAIGDKKKWNRGLGTTAVWEGLKKAFLYLRCKKVEVKIHKNNEASKKVFKKAGFRKKEEISGSEKHVYQLTLDKFLKMIA